MDINQLRRAAGITEQLAARWYPHITAAMNEFGITNPDDQAMFIAQVGHESGGFARLQENFNYSVSGLSGFIRAGRITTDQANALGQKHMRNPFLWSASVQSPIWYTANAWETTDRATDGTTVGAGLSRSPA